MKNTLRASQYLAILVCLSFFTLSFSNAFGLTITPPSVVCTNSPAVFNASFTPGTYIWSGNTSTTSTATYTFTGSGTYSITVTDPTGATASVTGTINASPTADAGNGYNLKCIPSLGTTLTLGGSPTGTGVGTLGYAWTQSPGSGTLSSLVATNPTVTGFSTTAVNTYTVVVTSSNGCSKSSSTNIVTQIFEEQLDGNSSASYGRVVSDMTTDTRGEGTLYSVGWYNVDMNTQKGPNQATLNDAYPGTGALYVMKHNPCDDNALIWFHRLEGFSTDCGNPTYIANTTSEVTHPFSPNIAQATTGHNSNDLFITFNASGTGGVARYTRNGTKVYITGIKNLVMTDIKADDNGNVFLAGYNTGTGVTIPGSSTVLNAGDIFIALINQTATGSLQCSWCTNVGLTTGGSPQTASPPSIGTITGGAYALINTGNKLRAYVSGTGALSGTGGALGSATDPTTRTATLGTATSGKIYGVDGTKVYECSYSVSGGTVSFATATTVTTAGFPNYDLKTHAASNTVYVITKNTLEAYDLSLAAVSGYGTGGASTYELYSSAGAIPYSGNPCTSNNNADRCLAIELSGNKEMFIGGSMEIGASLSAGSPFNFTPTVSSGFLARLITYNAGGTGALYKTSGGDDETTSLPSTPTTATGFNIYPNPTRGQLSIIAGTDEAEASYSIIGIDGRLMMSGTIAGKGEVNTISTESLAAGIYMIQVRSAGQVHTQKIVKQ